RNNDIGAAEVDNAVAIGNGVRHGEDLDGFLVVVFPSSILNVRIAGRRIERRLLLLHPGLNILMAEYCCALASVPELVGNKRARQARIGARCLKLFVAADMVAMKTRVDDELSRLRT